jgi:DNA polymerase-3 subunit alpha
MSLFGDLGGSDAVYDDARVPIPDTEFDKSARLAFEKEMLGLYISDHPLLGMEAALARHADTTIAELREPSLAGSGGHEPSLAGSGGHQPSLAGGGAREGELRWVGGVVTSLTRKYTKRGELMATFVLEDLQSAIDVWVFPRTMTDVGHLLVDDAVVCVKGRLDLREEQPKLICMELRRPELTVNGGEPLHLDLPVHALSDDRVDALKALFLEHPGGSPVLLHVGSKCIRLGSQWSVNIGTRLLAELRVLLGAGCLWSRGAETA